MSTFKTILDDLANDFKNDLRNGWPSVNEENDLASSVTEHDSFFEIMVDVPGVDKKDIDLAVENSYLIISAKRDIPEKRASKRWSGMRKMTYRISFPVIEKDISASLDMGILTVKIPKVKSTVSKIHIS